MLKRQIPALMICAVLLCLLSASALAVEFPDVSLEHWAHDDVVKASDCGLVQGLEDGTFRPEETLNRASFVTILQRMFGWETVTPTVPSFTDVPADAWYYAAVETARAHGVLDADTAFHPMGYITRSDMAVMLVRALGYDTLADSLAAAGAPFPDVTENAGHITVAAAIGMTNGIVDERTGQTLFQPASFATRGQAAAMLVRVYDRYTARVNWLHGFYAFSSYSQIAYTADMDAVSVGWARMSWDETNGAWLNSTSAGGNDWVKPNDASAATSYFQGNGTPYNLNVYADTAKLPLSGGGETSALDQVLNTEAGREQAVSALAAAAADYAGITIDFEGMKSADWRAPFVAFLTRLRAALPADKTLYVCVPPDDWYKGYDYRGIGEVCDKVILMAHDYQWTSVPDGYVGVRAPDSPVTPFPSIFRALSSITDAATGVQDRSKIALAISFGTAGFQVDGNGLLASQTIYHPAQATIARRLAQPDTVITYDAGDRNPCAVYTGDDGTVRYQLWYEDARSVTDKIELARMFGVNGVSLWRVGNIPSYAEDAALYYDVWPAILAQRP